MKGAFKRARDGFHPIGNEFFDDDPDVKNSIIYFLLKIIFRILLFFRLLNINRMYMNDGTATLYTFFHMACYATRVFNYQFPHLLDANVAIWGIKSTEEFILFPDSEKRFLLVRLYRISKDYD